MYAKSNNCSDFLSFFINRTNLINLRSYLLTHKWSIKSPVVLFIFVRGMFVIFYLNELVWSTILYVFLLATTNSHVVPVWITYSPVTIAPSLCNKHCIDRDIDCFETYLAFVCDVNEPIKNCYRVVVLLDSLDIKSFSDLAQF